MDQSTVIVEGQPSAASSAVLLTLTQGVSSWANWSFNRRDSGRKVSVGSSSGCDWQVVATGVPPVILLFSGDALWVGVEHPSRHVTCNGASLPRGWSRLNHGDVLALGAAHINVSLAQDLRTAEPKQADHAPPRERNTELDRTLVDAQPAAIVRLLRGSSPLSSWTFRANELGVSVSIGAGQGCDWQITTGSPEDHELTLLFAGGTLLAKSERAGSRVRLDGEPLSDDWTFVREGSRVEVGLACLQLALLMDGSGVPQSPLGASVTLPLSSQTKLGPALGSEEPLLLVQRSKRALGHASEDTTTRRASQRNPSARRSSVPPVRNAGRAQQRAAATQRLKLTRRGDPWPEQTNLVRQGAPSTRLNPSAPPQALRQHLARLELDPHKLSDSWVTSCVPAEREPQRGIRSIATYTAIALGVSALYALWLSVLDRI